MFELVYIELGRREFQCCDVSDSMLETADTDGYGRHAENIINLISKLSFVSNINTPKSAMLYIYRERVNFHIEEYI